MATDPNSRVQRVAQLGVAIVLSRASTLQGDPVSPAVLFPLGCLIQEPSKLTLGASSSTQAFKAATMVAVRTLLPDLQQSVPARCCHRSAGKARPELPRASGVRYFGQRHRLLASSSFTVAGALRRPGTPRPS